MSYWNQPPAFWCVLCREKLKLYTSVLLGCSAYEGETSNLSVPFRRPWLLPLPLQKRWLCSALGATAPWLLPVPQEVSGSPHSQRAMSCHMQLSGRNAPTGSCLSGCQLCFFPHYISNTFKNRLVMCSFFALVTEIFFLSTRSNVLCRQIKAICCLNNYCLAWHVKY